MTKKKNNKTKWAKIVLYTAFLLTMAYLAIGNAHADNLVTVCSPGLTAGNCGTSFTQVVSGVAEDTRILKASPGTLIRVTASNLTATAGYLLLFNSITEPNDGAVLPLACINLPANGQATIDYNAGPPQRFSTGITASVSNGANCFTKTTGTITAYFSGAVR